MIDQVKCLASWTNVKLNNRLGQRGAEMVEYAIVLACIAAVGVYFYSTGNSSATAGDGNVATNGLQETLTKLWTQVRDSAKFN